MERLSTAASKRLKIVKVSKTTFYRFIALVKEENIQSVMALKYKVVSTFSPGQGKDGKQIWFPKLTGSSQINLREIAKILHKRSTASESDVYLIVKGLVDLIPELLADGYTVKLDELGTFRLHAKVNTSESPASVSVKNINNLRLSFRPDKYIKNELRGITIVPEKNPSF